MSHVESVVETAYKSGGGRKFGAGRRMTLIAAGSRRMNALLSPETPRVPDDAAKGGAVVFVDGSQAQKVVRSAIVVTQVARKVDRVQAPNDYGLRAWPEGVVVKWRGWRGGEAARVGVGD